MYYVCVCVFRGTQQRTYHGVLYQSVIVIAVFVETGFQR